MANIFMAGGRGTMAETHADNGGGFVKGGDATWLTSQYENGGPVSNVDTWNGSSTACTLTDLGATTKITRGGGFNYCVAGTIANVKFNGESPADDRYEVLSVDPSGTWITIGLADIADSTHCDVHVGGAFTVNSAGIQDALDLFSVENGDELPVATNPASATVYPISAEITMPAVAGTLANPMMIYGVDYSDGGALTYDEAQPILQASGAITSIWSWLNTTDCYNVKDIDFDGNSNATYCWHFGDAAESRHYKTSHCRFRNAVSHGVYFQYTVRYITFIDNEVDNNGGDGINGTIFYSHFTNNKIYDNGSEGVYFSVFIGSSFEYNRVYGNGAKGAYFGTCNSVSINDNTVYDNVGDGIDIKGVANYTFTMLVINNTIFSNGGYGIGNINIGVAVWPKDMMWLSNNHSWDNASGHCREMDTPASDAEWADFMDGDNITGDPKCVNLVEESEDFDLLYNSPLIGAGINGSTIGAGSHDGGWPNADRPGGLIGEPVTGAF